MNQLRQHYFDSIRGIASVSVVIAHYLAAFYPYTILGSQGIYPQRTVWEIIIFMPPFGPLVHGPISVWLFFILSGYVLSYGYLGEPLNIIRILDAMLRRPIRLGGIVLFTIFLSSNLWWFHLYFNAAVAGLSHSKPWFSSFWEGEILPYKVLIDIITAMFKKAELYNPPFWTIRVELYGSLLIFLLMLVAGRLKYRLLLFLAVTISLLTVKSEFSRCSGLITGVMVADFVKTHNFIIRLKAKNLFSVILGLAFLYFSSYERLSRNIYVKEHVYAFIPKDSELGLYPLLSALSLFLLVITNDRLKSFLQHPLFQFLGKISYAMYAIHFIILGSVSSWLFLMLNHRLPYGLSFLLVSLLSAPIIILTSIWMTKYIDEPSTKAAAYASKRIIALGEKSISLVTGQTK